MKRRFSGASSTPRDALSRIEDDDELPQDTELAPVYASGSLGWLEQEWRRRDEAGESLSDLYEVSGVRMLEALALEWWRQSLSPRNLYKLSCEYFFTAGTPDKDWRTTPVSVAAGTLWARRTVRPPASPRAIDGAAVEQALDLVARGSPQRVLEAIIIWSHGNRSYSTDQKTPILVSAEQHNTLTAFLDKNEAKDTKTLEKAGVSNVTTVMNAIAEKFPGAVRRPGSKGEGYFVRVRTLPATATD
jgi:hypothetical protein